MLGSGPAAVWQGCVSNGATGAASAKLAQAAHRLRLLTPAPGTGAPHEATFSARETVHVVMDRQLPGKQSPGKQEPGTPGDGE